MTKQYLLEHGVRPNIKGYHYTIEAVKIVEKIEDIRVMEVYQIIADNHETSVSKVERAMRHAVQKKAGYEGTVGEFIFCAANGVI